jgi:hypothetical protein
VTREDDHIALWQFSDECRRLGTGRGSEILGVLQKALKKPGGGTQLGSAIRKVAESGIRDILVLTDGQTWDALPPLASELNIRVSAVLVGEASLDANIGHLCAMTGGELFYAPEAEVAHSVRLALNGKRSSSLLRELDLAEGRPQHVRRGIGGVEVTANWSEAMEIGYGTDIGRFAAGLCLGKMSEEAATALAVAEGLCSQATSLILVDDAGEASEGLSETRKVPLMEEAASMPAVSMSVAPTSDRSPLFSQFKKPDHPPRMMPRAPAAGSQAAPSKYDAPMDQLAPTPNERNMFARFMVRKSPIAISQERLARLANGIDWDTEINRFLSGDFSGLLEEEAALLNTIANDPALAPVLARTGLDPRLVLLAWLSAHYVTHSRAAGRFTKRVMDQLPGRNPFAEIDEVFFPRQTVEDGNPDWSTQ